MRDFTANIVEALRAGGARIIPRSSVFLSDRPLRSGQKCSRGTNGNSDIEAGHSFDIDQVIRAVGGNPGAAKASLNCIRLFGPISDIDFPHFHGYSCSELLDQSGRFHFIIMTVHMIGRYEAGPPGMAHVDGLQREIFVEDKPGLVLLHEADRVLKIEPLKTGDMIVLPSGVFHTFSAAPGIFAAYGALEVCDDAARMYQMHFDDEKRDPREIIGNTIIAAGVPLVKSIKSLALADVPGFEGYVESRC